MTREQMVILLRLNAGYDSFMTMNKYIWLAFDQDAPVTRVFSVLVTKMDRADQDGWFSVSLNEWKLILGISKFQLSRSIKKLVEMDVVEKRVIQIDGLPRLHYRLKEDGLSIILQKAVSFTGPILLGANLIKSPTCENPVNRPKVKSLNFGNYPINEWGLKWVVKKWKSKKVPVSIGSFPVSPSSTLRVLRIEIKYILNLIKIKLKFNLYKLLGPNPIGFVDLGGLTFKNPVNRPIIKLNGILIKKLPRKINRETLKKKGDPSTNKKGSKFSKSTHRKDPMIEYWNGLPGVRVHKDPSSKTYQRAKKRLDQLRKGSFHLNRLDPSFMRNKSISTELAKKKWFDIEIKEVLKTLGHMFLPGYWPEDKDWIPKDLNSLLFNDRRRNSWFLNAHVNGVPYLDVYANQRFLESLSEEDKETFHYFLQSLELTQNYKIEDGEYSQVYSMLRSIYKFHTQLKTVIRVAGSKHALIEYERWFTSKYHFATRYSDWLQEEFETSNDFSYHWAKVNGNVWKKYIKKTMTELGFEEFLSENF